MSHPDGPRRHPARSIDVPADGPRGIGDRTGGLHTTDFHSKG
ncbi:hypothetical protein ACX8Z9_13250 [Arthrobacter halodurans]